MYMSLLTDYLMCGYNYLMCGYTHADVNMNLGGTAKVKYKSKGTELWVNKAGTPVVKLLHFRRFMNKVALFH